MAQTRKMLLSKIWVRRAIRKHFVILEKTLDPEKCHDVFKITQQASSTATPPYFRSSLSILSHNIVACCMYVCMYCVHIFDVGAFLLPFLELNTMWKKHRLLNTQLLVILPVDPLIWIVEDRLFPETAVMAILYLLPAVRLENAYSFHEVLSWIWASCIFWWPSSNCTSYQVTLPEEGVHPTCRLVEVVFSLLISNLAGGKGSARQKPRKRRWHEDSCKTCLHCYNPDSFFLKHLLPINKPAFYSTSKLTI